MTITFALVGFAAAIGPLDRGIFGDFNRRNAATVAAELDSVAGLPTEAFDEIAPSVLALVRDSKSTALAIRAMDVMSTKAGSARAAELVGWLDERISNVGPETRLRTCVIVGAFIDSDLTTFGPGLRASPSTTGFLTRLAQSTAGPLDASYYGEAVDSLLAVLPAGSDPKPILLDLVDRGSLGAARAAEHLKANIDPATLDRVRQIAAAPGFKRSALDVLAHVGDEASLPTLQSLREATVNSSDPGRIQFIDNAIRRIQLQHPPSALIGCIRSPEGDGAIQYWAISRAVELNLDRSEIRNAILNWAASASPYYVGSVRDHAIQLNVLQPTDLASAPLSLTKGYGCPAPAKRRQGTAEVPDRRIKSARWRPNTANYDAFFDWYRDQDRQAWRALPDEEREHRIRQKLCELDLLSPDGCESLRPVSQPAAP